MALQICARVAFLVRRGKLEFTMDSRAASAPSDGPRHENIVGTVQKESDLPLETSTW